MGLFGDLFNNRDPHDDPDGDGPDHYRISRKTEKGGWQPVEGFDNLKNPMDKDVFEYNAAPLEPGQYRLFAVKDHLNTRPPDGVGWTLEIEDDSRATRSPTDEKIDRLMSEISELKNGNGHLDPTEAVEQQKAALQLQALQSPEFIQRHGDKLVMSMFGGDFDGGGREQPGFDDWNENPFGAALFSAVSTLQDEPAKIKDVGEALGGSIGAFLGGAADGVAPRQEQPQPRADDSGAEPDQEAAPVEDEQPQPRAGVNSGPSSPDDLAAAAAVPPGADTDPADLSDTIAQGRMARRKFDPPADPDDDTEDSHPTDALTADDEAPNATPAASFDPDEFADDVEDGPPDDGDPDTEDSEPPAPEADTDTTDTTDTTESAAAGGSAREIAEGL